MSSVSEGHSPTPASPPARRSFQEILYQHQSHKPPLDPVAEKWMTILGSGAVVRSTLGEASMSMIPMLGSHDSATYGIHESSDFAADAPKIIGQVPRYLTGYTKKLVSHWARCQSVSVIEQLYRGVRYFDMRLSPRKKDLAVTPRHPKDICHTRIHPPKEIAEHILMNSSVAGSGGGASLLAGSTPQSLSSTARRKGKELDQTTLSSFSTPTSASPAAASAAAPAAAAAFIAPGLSDLYHLPHTPFRPPKEGEDAALMGHHSSAGILASGNRFVRALGMLGSFRRGGGGAAGGGGGQDSLVSSPTKSAPMTADGNANDNYCNRFTSVADIAAAAGGEGEEGVNDDKNINKNNVNDPSLLSMNSASRAEALRAVITKSNANNDNKNKVDGTLSSPTTAEDGSLSSFGRGGEGQALFARDDGVDDGEESGSATCRRSLSFGGAEKEGGDDRVRHERHGSLASSAASPNKKQIQTDLPNPANPYEDELWISHSSISVPLHVVVQEIVIFYSSILVPLREGQYKPPKDDDDDSIDDSEIDDSATEGSEAEGDTFEGETPNNNNNTKDASEACLLGDGEHMMVVGARTTAVADASLAFADSGKMNSPPNTNTSAGKPLQSPSPLNKHGGGADSDCVVTERGVEGVKRCYYSSSSTTTNEKFKSLASTRSPSLHASTSDASAVIGAPGGAAAVAAGANSPSPPAINFATTPPPHNRSGKKTKKRNQRRRNASANAANDSHSDDDATTTEPPNAFLLTNLEVIILDFQKCTQFTPQHVKSFLDIMSPLMPLFVRKPKSMATPLKDLWCTPERIFVLFPTNAMSIGMQILTIPYTTPDQHSVESGAGEGEEGLGKGEHVTGGVSSAAVGDEKCADDPAQSIDPWQAVEEGAEERSEDTTTNALEDAAASSSAAAAVQNNSIAISVASAVSSAPSFLRTVTRKGEVGIAPIDFLYRRDDTVIISKWFNRRIDLPLYRDAQRELYDRSLVPIHKRTQAHVLQGVLTPTTQDLVESILTRNPRARSILEYACDVNSTLLGIWEAHGEMHRHITFPIEAVKDGQRRGRARGQSKPQRHHDDEDVRGRSSSSSRPRSRSRSSPAMNPVVDPLIPGSSVAVDGRNILMLDFFQVGRSPLGFDAFTTACWRPCLERFTNTTTPLVAAPQDPSEALSNLTTLEVAGIPIPDSPAAAATAAISAAASKLVDVAITQPSEYVRVQIDNLIEGRPLQLDPVGGRPGELSPSYPLGEGGPSFIGSGGDGSPEHAEDAEAMLTAASLKKLEKEQRRREREARRRVRLTATTTTTSSGGRGHVDAYDSASSSSSEDSTTDDDSSDAEDEEEEEEDDEVALLVREKRRLAEASGQYLASANYGRRVCEDDGEGGIASPANIMSIISNSGDYSGRGSNSSHGDSDGGGGGGLYTNAIRKSGAYLWSWAVWPAQLVKGGGGPESERTSSAAEASRSDDGITSKGMSEMEAQSSLPAPLPPFSSSPLPSDPPRTIPPRPSAPLLAPLARRLTSDDEDGTDETVRAERKRVLAKILSEKS